ncbi:SDR family NAD(P)-dependent oxidoreductase (plasmid) [Microvirga sp. VF16]|nr:SDR family NAD(P)-dependent oxidoreductase [Microvirga sp. VF16]QRM33015.1 SDR family NAD(P)-dependent oxidoreductase [Microvirga sp. VF16]
MAIDISVPLHGKVALVTGSTSGIGLATARLLASNGADVALHGFASADEIEQILAGITREFGRTARYFDHDLSDMVQASQLVTDVTAAFGRVDTWSTTQAYSMW